MAAVERGADLDSRYCGGPKRQGSGTCTRPAGWGTPHPGIGRCKLHGGSTHSHVVAAGKVLAQREVTRLGQLRDVDPHTVLLEEVQRSAAAVALLSERVEQIGDSVTDSDRGWMAWWERERRQSVVAAKAAIDAGVDVRRVELEQARVSMQASAVRAAMDAVGMGEEERVVFVRAMMGQLRVEGGAS
jgi:hypothetical protein